MALSRVKVWVAEVLSFSDLNSEFNNILNNPVSLISPLTGNLDVDGYTITLDAAAVTTVNSTAAVSWNFTSGAKTGTPATTGSVLNFSAQTFTDNATAASGTATAYTAYALQRPTLAASNLTVTTTDAATLYIPNNVAAGTNETITNSWAIWADAGNVRFDDDIHWLSGQTFAQRGVLAHANTGVRTYTFPDADGTMFTTAGGTVTGDITMSGASIVETEGAAVTAASSTNIWATDGNTVHVTGNTGITDFGTAPQAGAWMKVIFDGTPLLTQSANLNLNAGGANITIAADDFAFVYADTTTQMDVFVIRKNGTAIVDSDTAAATQAEQETGSSTTVYVSPGTQHFHPSALKVWGSCGVAGDLGSPSYNVTSVGDTATGRATVTIATDFSTAVYPIVPSVEGSDLHLAVVSKAAGSFELRSTNNAGTLTDPTTGYNWMAAGDLA